MATHDYVIDNQSASAFRSDLNGALQAIVTQNSNATAPATTYANMIWYDTAANQLKKRNEANSAWIVLGTVNEGTGTFTPSGERALASQAEAEAGTDNTKLMTPLRVAQAIAPDYTSSGFTLTQNYRGTFAHGFGATPSLIVMRLRCVTAQANFSVNDVVYFYSGGYDNGTGQAFQFAADTTNIYLGTYWTYVRNKTTGVDSPAWIEITYANWQATIVAWK